MPPLETPAGGYLRRVLASGVRLPQLRSGVRALLGGSRPGAVRHANIATLGGFRYLDSGDFPSAPDPTESTSPDSPPLGATPSGVVAVPFAPDATGNVAALPNLAPPRVLHVPDSRSSRGPAPADTKVIATPATSGDPTATMPSGDAPAPAAVGAPAVVARRKLETPDTPAVSARTIGAPAVPAPRVAELMPVEPTPEVTSGAPTLNEPDRALQDANFSPAMRALLPFLGRIHVADADAATSPPAAPDAAGDRPSRPSAKVNANVRAPLDAAVGLPPPPPRFAGVVAAAPPARVEAPRAAMAPVINRATAAAQQAIAQLRKATQAAKEATPPPADAGAANVERETRAPARIERVVTTRVVTRTQLARAFWERRYLGRPHMRAFR